MSSYRGRSESLPKTLAAALWIAAIDPVGALAYGATNAEANRKAKAIALEVLADRLNAGESAATGRKTRKPTTFSELHFVA